MSQHTRTQLAADIAASVKKLAVQVLDGPDKGRYCEGKSSLAVGTSPDNELVLSDPMVSRYHLEVRLDGGIRVTDLQSRNGTFVGELRLHDAVVQPGTRLRIGNTVLSVVDADIDPPSVELDAPEIPGMVIASQAMRKIAKTLTALAASNASVLIQGETGTGKDVLARAIHQCSPRASGPFVVVDAGALAPTLIASQLFGHEKGAFTGADRRQIGAFEQAHGGTVFLDEIGELPLSVQPALLGVLERRRFKRLGGTQDISTDVRLISATNRDLRAETNAGTFRSDLYFRIAVARIVVPPLRERPEEIPALVEHFAEEITGAPGQPFSAATLDALRAHRFTGNVRELRNVVESALAMGQVALEGEGEGHAPHTGATPDADGPLSPYSEARAAALQRFEREYLSRLIAMANGNASAASRLAKMDRQYLLGLLRRHGLR